MTDPANELQSALAALQAAFEDKTNPNRHQVRSIYIPLGMLILEGSLDGIEATLERLAGLLAPRAEAWEQAVHEELRLAQAEYCQSVDPRYLGRPGYDLAYTIAARERLEARLAAAKALGQDLPPGLEESVQASDAVLEPYLEAEGPAGGSPGESGGPSN